MVAIYIMMQNTLVIYHYHKRWREVAPLLFILIAAVDIGSAYCEVVRGTVALMCLKNESTRISPWLIAPCLFFGICSYIISTFLGAVNVMAVVKTISIGHPFYPLNERALKIWLIIVSSIYLLLSKGNVWVWIAVSFDNKSH